MQRCGLQQRCAGADCHKAGRKEVLWSFEGTVLSLQEERETCQQGGDNPAMREAHRSE